MERGALQRDKGDNRESGCAEPGLQGASTCGMNCDTTRETKGETKHKRKTERRPRRKKNSLTSEALSPKPCPRTQISSSNSNQNLDGGSLVQGPSTAHMGQRASPRWGPPSMKINIMIRGGGSLVQGPSTAPKGQSASPRWGPPPSHEYHATFC